jgi:DNA damage-binding protein 1
VLASGSDYRLKFTWSTPDNTIITSAAANPSQIVACLGGHTLVYLQVVSEQIIQTSLRKLENEVSCVDVSVLHASSLSSAYCAIGTWTNESVRLLSLPSLEEAHVVAIDEGIFTTLNLSDCSPINCNGQFREI